MADDQEDKQKAAEALRARVAERLGPILADPRNRLKTMVAVRVLSIVTREIGQGEPRRESDWEGLREAVAGQPGAEELVANLEAAMRKYADELRARIASGEMEEQPAREAALKVIQLALLRKLGLLERVAEA